MNADKGQAVRDAISDLESDFWDEEDVHNVDVRLDVMASALYGYVSMEGVLTVKLDEAPSLWELLKHVNISKEAADAARDLSDYAAQVAYGVSALAPGDVADANACLGTLHSELDKWFASQHKMN